MLYTKTPVLSGFVVVWELAAGRYFALARLAEPIAAAIRLGETRVLRRVLVPTIAPCNVYIFTTVVLRKVLMLFVQEHDNINSFRWLALTGRSINSFLSVSPCPPRKIQLVPA